MQFCWLFGLHVAVHPFQGAWIKRPGLRMSAILSNLGTRVTQGLFREAWHSRDLLPLLNCFLPGSLPSASLHRIFAYIYFPSAAHSTLPAADHGYRACGAVSPSYVVPCALLIPTLVLGTGLPATVPSAGFLLLPTSAIFYRPMAAQRRTER